MTHCPLESFAHADGIVCGDEIVAVAGQRVEHGNTVDDVIDLLRTSPRPTELVVRRWTKNLFAKCFAVWIGPDEYAYREANLPSAAPTGS